MAAQVGLTWENNPYNPALFGVNQALPAPANVYAPALTPTGAAYTWITDQGLTADELEVDLVLGPGKDLADVTLDLARVYSYILRDIFTHDPQQIAVSTRQLVNLIRCVTRRFILPVRNLLRAVNPRPARYQPLNLLLIVMENYIPEVGNPLGPYESRNWVSTKSHLELALETFIARNNNWAALRPGLFVAPDRTLVDLQLAPPLPTRTGWFTFERNMVNARRSASPFVLSITEGPPPAPPAPGNGRVLAGASLPKADGYDLLRNWACAARMQRYEALICNNINNALTSRDQPINNIHNNRVGPNRNLAGFQNAVVAYKAATNDFFYHPHRCVSYEANSLSRRTFCWSCWTIYRFDANETANDVRWAEFSNYEPPTPVALPPVVNLGNCAEAMLHQQCARWGAHGMVQFAQNAGHSDVNNGNWVNTAAVPVTPAAH